MNLDHIKRIAITAARNGAEVLQSYFGRVSAITKKSAIDLVTEADTESEKRIIATIRRSFPDHAILAEESGHTDGDSEHLWLIDPLDGTTNFAHCVPIYAVSIALAVRGQIVVGIVLNPASGELFAASQGHGAQLNARAIGVSQIASVSDSLLATGFPYDFRNLVKPVMTRLRSCAAACQGVRRIGSAALDLCYVACGRFEGFWEERLKPWDTAAGYLIASEAGATVTNFQNQPYSMDHQDLVATNGRIHKEMLALLRIED
jgi:myo-inositol-1(or 4)-monophosphatase